MPVWLAPIVASKWFKIGLGVVAVLALVLSINAGIKSVKAWEKSIHDDAYNAGFNTNEARWQKASAENARAQLASFAANVDRSNSAMAGYLKDLADKAPLLVPVKERTTVYAQSPAGTATCTDADGVRLLQQYRAASGLGGQASTAPATPGPVR